MRASRAGRIGVAWGVRARPLSDRAVRKAVRAALAHGGRAGIDIEVAMVSERCLSALHGRFLGDPSPTDVISLDLGEEGGGPVGEIYVCVDQAREVARERGVPLARELCLYLVHGTLHLCGFDDRGPRDRVRMRAAESAVLAALGHPPESRKRIRGRTRDLPLYRKTGKTARA